MQLTIDGWKQHICFSAAHFLPQHEKCSILHGHTYVVSCTITGTPDPTTHMILDFTQIKQHLKQLTEQLDHHILIPEKHPSIEKTPKETIIKNNNKTYILPNEDCIYLPIESTTAEHLAQYLLTQLIKQIPTTKYIHTLSLQIDEGLGQSATAEHKF